MPLEKVNHVVICPSPSHCNCGCELNIDGQFERHQVFEVPKPSYEVIEYQLKKGYCKSRR